MAGRTPRIEPPDPSTFASLVDLIDDAAERYRDAEALTILREDGSRATWTFPEFRRRSELAASRLRHELGLQPGDRMLTWSPSAREVPAVYTGAMRAGVIFVPLDLRMAPEAMQRIGERSEAKALAYGTGRDAGDPKQVGLGAYPARSVDELTADAPSPAEEDAWISEVRSWPRPTRDDVFEIVYTSGTTGTPKGVMLTHGNLLATIEGGTKVIEVKHHRVVSVLPLSHLFEQLVFYYAMSLGAPILYVRWRSARVLLEAIREHRTTTMVVVPQILELFWTALTREMERRGALPAFNALRAIARHLPYPIRRRLFTSIHRQLGGELTLFICSGAFLPPALQQGWEDLGVIVQQGFGATETGLATVTTKRDHGLGTVGRPMPPNEVSLADDGEILVRGPAVFKGYWEDPAATAGAFDADGWYRTSDVGHWDPKGHLVLSGRKKNMIVLPNGFNVFPEDIENELHTSGIREAVVLETSPGRIEAVVLAGAGPAAPRPVGEHREGASAVTISNEERARIDAAIKDANRRLGISQRVEGWRLWPEEDFPRTHTLKVKRGQVRAWVAADTPLPVA